MRPVNFILLIAFVINFIPNSIAQKKAPLLPADLTTEKVIFLAYERIENDVNMPYAQRKRNTYRNKASIDANKELKLQATYYPFGYVISNRSDYHQLINSGYKYVLENDMMNSYNYGENIEAGTNTIYTSTMYLKDLSTGKRYELFSVKQHLIYEYGTIMKRFCKLIKKEYGIK